MDYMQEVWYHPATSSFRRLFYLVSPNETSYETVKQVPHYVLKATPCFIGFVILEAVLLLVKGQNTFRVNDAVSSIGAGIIDQLFHIYKNTVTFFTYVWVYENLRVTTLPWDSPTAWLGAFLAVDFGYYWLHRMAHEVNLFWGAHQTHHSSEYYNFTTALRQSAFQSIFSWMFYIPVAFCGVAPSIFLVHSQFNLLYQFWIHTEVVGSLGPLEYIINTPSNHRVHHGRNRYCIDKNYGGTLIIFDVIFGTHQLEKEKVVFGVTHPIETFDPFYTQMCHFMYMWNKFWEVKGLNHKLSVIFKGPGWEPGKPRTGLLEDIPDVHAPMPRYDPQISIPLQVYIILHFVLIVCFYVLVSTQIEMLGNLRVIGCILYILVSLTSFGMLTDRRERGTLLETVRCLCTTCFFGLTDLPEVFQMTYFSNISIFTYGLSSLLLVTCCITSCRSKTKRE